MICKEYEALSHIEKITLIGGIVHAIQSDSSIFQMALEIKRLAILKGLFDGVVINPPMGETIEIGTLEKYYRSEDGGETWEKINPVFPVNPPMGNDERKTNENY